MKYILFFVTVGILVLAFSVRVFAAQGLVGGNCTYDQYSGKCTATSIDDQGKTRFTFKGTVKGQKLVLHDNIASKAFAVGTEVRCSLEFEKTGTCTPCLLSIGECGREGFDALRMKSPAPSEQKSSSTSSGGSPLPNN